MQQILAPGFCRRVKRADWGFCDILESPRECFFAEYRLTGGIINKYKFPYLPLIRAFCGLLRGAFLPFSANFSAAAWRRGLLCALLLAGAVACGGGGGGSGDPFSTEPPTETGPTEPGPGTSQTETCDNGVESTRGCKPCPAGGSVPSNALCPDPRICNDKSIVLEDGGICLEDCADSEELRGGACAPLECDVGRATNHACPETRLCLNGDLKLRSALCLEDCADNEELRGIRCASLECEVGEAANHECPATQTCLDNSIILETDACMQTCINGEKILESENCMQTCPDDSVQLRILESETCMRDCPVVGLLPFSSACPATEICGGDGSEVLVSEGCRTCPVAGSIPAGESCPATEVCGDGTRVLSGGCQDCPAVGSIPKSESCPAVKTCDDGSFKLLSAFCLEDCAGNEELRGGVCAFLNCALGEAANHECPPTTFCGNGSRVLVSEGCRICPAVAGSIPANESCPPTKTCDDGSIKLETAACLEDCAGNEELRGGVCARLECAAGVAANHQCPPTRTCEDGSIKLETALCLEDCRDNEELRGGVCAVLDCAAGVAVNHACPAFKTCDDGSRILTSLSCLEDCAGNQELRANQCVLLECAAGVAVNHACPATKTCDDESEILASLSCLEDCAGNEELRANRCVLLRCPAGVAVNHACPPTKTCPDGSVVVETANCPNTIDCNGERIPSGLDCTAYRLNYGLRNIGAAEAFRQGAFGQGTTVAVIDSGMDVSHIGLRANIVPGVDFTDPQRSTVITDENGHGTMVGGVIAGAPPPGVRSPIGVAPHAKLMPLKAADSQGRFIGDVDGAVEYALRQNVHVVNNSYGASAHMTGTYLGAGFRVEVPEYVAFGLRPSVARSIFQFNEESAAKAMRDRVRGKDTIMVYAAGNDGWNSESGVVIGCTDTTVSVNDCPDSLLRRISRENLLNNFVLPGNITLSSIDGIRGNFPSTRSLFPLFAGDNPGTQNAIFAAKTPADFAPLIADAGFADIVDRWLSVISLDSDGGVSSFSNGCGPSKFWCLGAPGRNIRTTFPNNRTTSVNGTSFSAPHVSGALAVVKSRYAEMPMPVVRAIILSTATPRGTRAETGELDDIYGWGALNLSAAVNFSTVKLSMIVAPPAPPPDEDDDDESGETGGGIDEDETCEALKKLTGRDDCLAGFSASIPLSQARIDLPAALTHLKPQLRAAKAAVSFNGDAYFNMPLSGIAHAPAAAESELGDAAADMLRPQADNRFSEGVFFAATDTKTNQFRYAGAELSAPKFGDWSMRYDFCEDCKKSAWQEWKIFSKDENGIANANIGEEITAPFFAHNEKSFALQMKGEGLRPFASFGEANGMPYEQYGLRLRQNYARFGWQAEASQTNEAESFLGANFGAFGKTSSKTTEGKIALHGDIAKNWRGFAGYSRAKSKVQTAGVLSAVDGIKAQGWSAGMEWQNIFSGGDRIRFTARQKMSINGGRAILRYSEAEGDFTQAFYGNLPGAESQDAAQELKERTLQLDLSEKANPSIAIGYAAELKGAELAIGAEYGNNGKKAISAQFRIDW